MESKNLTRSLKSAFCLALALCLGLSQPAEGSLGAWWRMCKSTVNRYVSPFFRPQATKPSIPPSFKKTALLAGVGLASYYALWPKAPMPLTVPIPKGSGVDPNYLVPKQERWEATMPQPNEITKFAADTQHMELEVTEKRKITLRTPWWKNPDLQTSPQSYDISYKNGQTIITPKTGFMMFTIKKTVYRYGVGGPTYRALQSKGISHLDPTKAILEAQPQEEYTLLFYPVRRHATKPYGQELAAKIVVKILPEDGSEATTLKASVTTENSKHSPSLKHTENFNIAYPTLAQCSKANGGGEPVQGALEPNHTFAERRDKTRECLDKPIGTGPAKKPEQPAATNKPAPVKQPQQKQK